MGSIGSEILRMFQRVDTSDIAVGTRDAIVEKINLKLLLAQFPKSMYFIFSPILDSLWDGSVPL